MMSECKDRIRVIPDDLSSLERKRARAGSRNCHLTNQLYVRTRAYTYTTSNSNPRHPTLSVSDLPTEYFLLSSDPFIMASLSPPPPTRNRASSTNLRPALTLATLGPRPKACSLLDSVPGTPPVTPDMRKATPSLASPSRLSLLIERFLVLFHVYPHLPSYSTPSSPRSPSEDSVLPMSSTTTVCGDDVEEKKTALPSLLSSRAWFQSTPSVC